MFNALVILFLLALVAALRGHERRLSRIEAPTPAPRFCVHITYTGDSALWGIVVLPEGVKPVVTEELPRVMVYPPMEFEAARLFAQVFHDRAAEGADCRDYLRGHA
jgi:hypothetical protein